MRGWKKIHKSVSSAPYGLGEAQPTGIAVDAGIFVADCRGADYARGPLWSAKLPSW